METPGSRTRASRVLSTAIKAETLLFMADLFVLPVAKGVVEYRIRENHWPEGQKGWFRLAVTGFVLWVVESFAKSKNKDVEEQE